MDWIWPSSIAINNSHGEGIYGNAQSLFVDYHGSILPSDSQYKAPNDGSNSYDFTNGDATICLVFNAIDRTISYSVDGSTLKEIFANINISNEYKLSVCMQH